MLFLHIAAAGVWLGANVMQLAVARVVDRHGGVVAASWNRTFADLGRTLYMPVGTLVALTGVVLVLNSSVYTFGSRFVIIGLTVVIIGAVLGPTVFMPGGHRAADAIEADDRALAGAERKRLTRFGILDTSLILLAMAVMVLRWT